MSLDFVEIVNESNREALTTPSLESVENALKKYMDDAPVAFVMEMVRDHHFNRGTKELHLIVPDFMEYWNAKHKPNTCENCGNDIRVICFSGTNHCSENCRKELSGE